MKIVFPVAGVGTRFLPATKEVPKEILPILDKPLIQYAVEEAVQSGLADFIFITARGKEALERHFAPNPDLNNFLERHHKTHLLDGLQIFTHAPFADPEDGFFGFIDDRVDRFLLVIGQLGHIVG